MVFRQLHYCKVANSPKPEATNSPRHDPRRLPSQPFDYCLTIVRLTAPTTASRLLHGDEIATSRGIFTPHFAIVPAYVKVMEYRMLLSHRRDMPQLPQMLLSHRRKMPQLRGIKADWR